MRRSKHRAAAAAPPPAPRSQAETAAHNTSADAPSAPETGSDGSDLGAKTQAPPRDSEAPHAAPTTTAPDHGPPDRATVLTGEEDPAPKAADTASVGAPVAARNSGDAPSAAPDPAAADTAGGAATSSAVSSASGPGPDPPEPESEREKPLDAQSVTDALSAGGSGADSGAAAEDVETAQARAAAVQDDVDEADTPAADKSSAKPAEEPEL